MPSNASTDTTNPAKILLSIEALINPIRTRKFSRISGNIHLKSSVTHWKAINYDNFKHWGSDWIISQFLPGTLEFYKASAR
jgi:hypothetical protein